MNSRFLLFSASAGSGKTYSLAVQFITLLVSKPFPQEYAQTLAVTFTNKATAEMKDRIIEQLYGIGKGLKKSDGYLEDIQQELKNSYGVIIEDSEVRRRCLSALKRILHDYSHFYICTIDAFFQIVLRNMAHELGLNANLQVEIGDKKIQELAVDRIIDNLRTKNDEIYKWLDDYIDEKIRDGKKWDVRREIKNLSGLLFNEEYLKRSLSDSNKTFDVGNIKEFRKVLYEEIDTIMGPCLKATNEFEAILHKFDLDYSDFSYGGGDVKKYIATLKAKEIPAEVGKRLASRMQDANNFWNAAERNDGKNRAAGLELQVALNKIHAIHTSIAHRINSLALAMKNMAPMAMLNAIEKEVHAINEENNQFSLSNTPILLNRMIKGDDSPFVFERIGTRFNNIMIDEFQDTSSLQWENFKVLLMNNLAEGGLGMIVGDIKQSIYRWRNGDWQILYGLSKTGLSNSTMDKRPLATNWRSKKVIVDFNNRFFLQAAEQLDNLATDTKIKIKDIYADVEQEVAKKNKEGGYVRIYIKHTEEKSKEDSVAWHDTMLKDMGEQIEKLHTEYNVPYSKMTILLRKKKHIEPMIEFFAKENPSLKLVSDEAFYLRYSSAINIIISALNVVNEHGQTDCNPVPLRYLMKEYLNYTNGTEANMSIICNAKPGDVLPEDFIGKIHEIKSMPLYEACEYIYRTLRLAEIKSQDAYMFAFFDELSSYLRENPSDITTFLRYWDEEMNKKTIPSGAVDGIRIFTVHKSKGLQFHTVFIPYCEDTIEKDRNDDMIWHLPSNSPENSIGTIPITPSAKMKESDYKEVYENEHCNKRTDELNVLYVGFTRAEVNLFVWGESKSELQNGNTSETCADLIYNCLTFTDEQYTEGQLAEYIEEEKEKSENRIAPEYPEQGISMYSYEGKIEFQQSRPAAEFVHMGSDNEQIDEKQLSYIEKGKLLHYIFSKIELADDIDQVVQEMIERGILKGDNQAKEVKEYAKNGLQNDLVSEWFSGKYMLHNEHNILLKGDKKKVDVRRPDRVMVSDDRIIVVDYKFGSPNEDYKYQVEMYIDILQQMEPEKTVEGYLWYVYRNKVDKI